MKFILVKGKYYVKEDRPNPDGGRKEFYLNIDLISTIHDDSISLKSGRTVLVNEALYGELKVVNKEDISKLLL